MAIGTPVERYANFQTAQATTTTLASITLTAGTVAIIAAKTSGTFTPKKDISSVSDTLGNTWTVDATTPGTARALSFASAQITSGGTSTITITWGNTSATTAAIWVQEVSGLATSSVFDQTANSTGTSTSPTTTATPTLSQADEIVWGLFATTTSTTWTPGAGFTNATTATLESTFDMLEYQIVSSTTGIAATGTFGTSGTWTALAATYKGAQTPGGAQAKAFQAIPFMGAG